MCSFVNKVYNNCNKISYLQKNETCSEEGELFSGSYIYQKLLIVSFPRLCPCDINTENQLKFQKVFIKVRLIVDCLGKNLKFFLRSILLPIPLLNFNSLSRNLKGVVNTSSIHGLLSGKFTGKFEEIKWLSALLNSQQTKSSVLSFFVLRNLTYGIFKVSCVSFCEYDHMLFLVRSDALAVIYKFINFGKRQITHSFTAIFSGSNIGRS